MNTKQADNSLGLDGDKIGRELDELLAQVGPETERIFASLGAPEPETREQMHSWHAAAGRLLQEAGLRYFASRKKARHGKSERTYRAA